MAKDVGSKKVIMVLCALLIHYPYIYRIDMPSHAELIAHRLTIDEVTDAIGADLIIFQMLPDLVASMRQLNLSIERFKCSVFNGEYVTGGVDAVYLDHLKGIWSDYMKDKVVWAHQRAGGCSHGCDCCGHASDFGYEQHCRWFGQHRHTIH